MAMQPVRNPSERSMNRVNGMFIGKSIQVFGKVKCNAERFSVNLFSGNDDIALHVDVRFNEGVVVRNTRRSGSWGSEERCNEFPNIFRGQFFSVMLRCEESLFQIHINGSAFCTYDHRLPYGSITDVSIHDDADVFFISSAIEGADLPAQVFSKPSERHFDIPFYSMEYQKVTVTGRPGSEGRFSLNFMDEKNDDIFMHFDARISDGVIVRNTKINSEWQNEERDLSIPFPFIIGVPMTIEVKVDKQGYHISINGSEVVDYNHRVGELEKIRKVVIYGDLDVEKVVFA